jgi:hypothetical protein
MHPPLKQTQWLAVSLLNQRFRANLSALAIRDRDLSEAIGNLAPSKKYFISTENDQLTIGVGEPGAVKPLPVVLSPATAHATVQKMYPGNMAGVALVAGEDAGWLWNRLYEIPCSFASAPGHRQPVYFLIRDLERLWLILHIQDWRVLLTDLRVRLFAGDDCVGQFQRSLLSDPTCPWPDLSVTVSPEIWPSGMSFESIIAQARGAQNAELARLGKKLYALSARNTAAALAEKFGSGRPLRVLGLTSRYTTFIQYSMRDWLAAFDRLGHTTRLVLEAEDHHLFNNLAVASICVEFEPDLVVAIDHYRQSLSGIPDGVPVMMWVQDALPTLFNRAAGAAQGPLDFAMGLAPLKMIHEFDYPAERYMPALIGVNEERFKTRRARTSREDRFVCDVSFVSHASTTAEALLENHLQKVSSTFARPLLTNLLHRFQEIYDRGETITETIAMRRLLELSLAETKLDLAAKDIPVVLDFFGSKINNALFRHQSLKWLADAGVDLRLYGNGWEKHPTLSRFARGPADNQSQLDSIYRGSKINLQISPFGAVHQRVMEGLASGGFFLLRHCLGELMERHFKPIWKFCQARGITTDAELARQATPEICARLALLGEAEQRSPFELPWPLVAAMKSSDEHGYIRCAGTIWEQDYDAVSFNSAAELKEKVVHFLQDEDDRKRRAESMRQVVLERFTYTRMTGQLLDFVAEGLRHNAAARAAA